MRHCGCTDAPCWCVTHDLKDELDSLRYEFQQFKEDMDKQIKKIEKQTGKVQSGLKNLEKEDKKRDKVCDYGEEMMKKKKK